MNKDIMNLRDKLTTSMTNDPITVGQDERLGRVDEIFTKNNIHHLPVVQGSKLIGMVSKSDLLFFKEDTISTTQRLKALGLI